MSPIQCTAANKFTNNIDKVAYFLRHFVTRFSETEEKRLPQREREREMKRKGGRELTKCL